jgi:2-succinyl-6-hydroxy-2,4-cyclohexadiene-1-carboxylate synthase
VTRLLMVDGVGYSVAITGSGPPLLLLHGFTGSGATWTPHLPTLAAEHRTIVVDLLGHGASDAPPAPRHAIERQAADLVGILARLDAIRADVLGYSLGARVALRLAIDAPEVVHRLVLESPSAGIAEADARAIRREADMRWVDQLERGDRDGFVRDWAAQPIFASQARLASTIRAQLATQRRAHRLDGLAASMLGAGQGVMTPMHDQLGDIRAPTLVISGRLDPRGTERAAEIATSIPDAIHEAIADAGHAAHLETPARFLTLVHDFLGIPVAPATPPTAT